uniref:RNA-dependent RNA polymerase n=1 Tax=Paris mitovirus 1 TaxID=2836141 RepID=A0A8E6YKA1_9VIRU|nr:RNA-dependent RNA polymerase [Paris mitovirus 1]
MNLFKIFEKRGVPSWRKTFERFRTIQYWLLMAGLVVAAKWTKEMAILALCVARKMWAIGKKSGLLHLAHYLKQCSSSLQMAYGKGEKVKPSLLPVSISLSRSGYPTIIPAYHRKVMAEHSSRSDMLVRLYLSWFSMFKLIALAKPVSTKTFESIVKEPSDNGRILSICGELKTTFTRICGMYVPWINTIPVNQGIRWIPIWKATPNNLLWLHGQAIKVGGRLLKKSTSIFTSLLYEMCAYGTLLQLEHATETLFSSGILWRNRVRYALDPMNTTFANIDLTWFEKWIGPTLPRIEHLVIPSGRPVKFGKLACAIEGGGKRRIFAIGNYVKQRLLRPYHDWFSTVLGRIPNDGTYNQLAPLRHLEGHKLLYSFGLKSAIDRWPLTVMYSLVSCLFGPSLASSIVQSALSFTPFVVERPFVKKEASVCFVTGQPLGYHCSWPLFALSHHWVVWMAAFRVYGTSASFQNYAVLGDDIVLADSSVAAQYQSILADLGVEISYQKSLVSSSGAFEFAKRFVVKEGRVDCSPVSIRSLFMSRTILGLVAIRDKYDVSFKTLCRLGGAGYKVLGRLYHSRSKKFERLHIACNKPTNDTFPLEWWIGRGRPLNPYLRGRCVEIFLKTIKPKEIRILPEELEGSVDRVELHERTLYRNWMLQYLTHLKWYCEVAMNPDVSLYELLNSPIVETNWQRSNKETILVRYGVIWKLYDLVGQLGLDWLPGILGAGDHPAPFNGCYIMSIMKEDGFLMSTEDLIKPLSDFAVI